MTDWRTLIKEDLSPPQSRSPSLSKHTTKPAQYQKVNWNDKTSERQQQILKIKQEQAKIDTILSPHSKKDITPELVTKSAKRQVTLKKKLDTIHKEDKIDQQKRAISRQLSDLKSKIQELKTEITQIDRFLSNPFTDKKMSSEQRKSAWVSAANKKKALEKQISETVKIYNKLALEEKVTRRR